MPYVLFKLKLGIVGQFAVNVQDNVFFGPITVHNFPVSLSLVDRSRSRLRSRPVCWYLVFGTWLQAPRLFAITDGPHLPTNLNTNY